MKMVHAVFYGCNIVSERPEEDGVAEELLRQLREKGIEGFTRDYTEQPRKKLNLLEWVTPADFRLDRAFADSPFKNFELETVSRNLFVILSKDGNQWKPFSWEDYKKGCGDRKVSDLEHSVLNQLVESGHLKCEKGKYSVTQKFIVTLWEFLKPDKK